MTTGNARPMRALLLAALLQLLGSVSGHADDISPFNELSLVAEIPISGEYAANIVQSGSWNEGRISVFQGIGNNSAIEQVGTGNYAEIIQGGDMNLASQYQQGAGNTARINQQGTGNKTAQQQIGNNNYIATTQIGSNNYVSATQATSGGYLNQTQIGTGLSYIVTQTGVMTLTINQSN